MNTRVPYDREYTGLVGVAVYVFSYYEWGVICIIEHLEPGFVDEYCRGWPMSSNDVRDRLKETMDLTSRNDVLKSLESLYDTMGVLVSKRNALIHAHPISDMNGDQILNYQGRLSKPIPDKRWRPDEVRAFITEVDEAACHAGELLSKLPAL